MQNVEYTAKAILVQKGRLDMDENVKKMNLFKFDFFPERLQGSWRLRLIISTFIFHIERS